MDARIDLLGSFRVTVDGAEVPGSAWPRRSASALVKLLALAPGHAQHREQVLDALWPALSPEDAAPRLHSAAHYARRALGDRSGVVLRGDVVALLPGADVTVDVDVFLRLAGTALFDVTERVAGHEWTEPELRGLLRELSAAMSDEVDALCALDRGTADAVA